MINKYFGYLQSKHYEEPLQTKKDRGREEIKDFFFLA